MSDEIQIMPSTLEGFLADIIQHEKRYAHPLGQTQITSEDKCDGHGRPKRSGSLCILSMKISLSRPADSRNHILSPRKSGKMEVSMRRKAIDLGLAYQKTRDAERAAAEANSVLEAAQHTYEERASEHLLALARSTGLLRLSPDHLEKLFGHWEEEARGAVELSLSDLKSPASVG